MKNVYYRGIKKVYDENNCLISRDCSTCGEHLEKNMFPNTSNKSYKDGIRGKCKKCMYEYHKKYSKKHEDELVQYRRKYNEENREVIKSKHIIPTSIGHGGTTIQNCYPMDSSLNYSKGNKNPFEWIKQKNVLDKVDFSKWEKLIRHLSNINGLTVEEFREYVYWCFDNPRSINDIIDETSSVELWKKRGVRYDG